MALDAAARGGGDTDTVAAIAGGLLGAAYGASAVPAEWRRMLHGWPGLSTRDLVTLATRIIKADRPFTYDVDPMIAVGHPHDDGVDFRMILRIIDKQGCLIAAASDRGVADGLLQGCPTSFLGLTVRETP